MEIITSKIFLCYAPVPKIRLVDPFEHQDHRVLKEGSIQVLSPQGESMVSSALSLTSDLRFCSQADQGPLHSFS